MFHTNTEYVDIILIQFDPYLRVKNYQLMPGAPQELSPGGVFGFFAGK
jgi:hypothetical protein